MATGMNIGRVKDLEAALSRAKPRDRLKLDELAMLWGTTKPRFVTTRNQMTAFPDAVDRDGNEYIYPARKAIRAMLAYEKRHEVIAKRRQEQANLIMGVRRAEDQDEGPAHGPSELAILSRLRADVEERERLQGIYIPRAEVSQKAGEMFAIISDFASRLANEIDPHGRLTPEIRTSIDTASKVALTKCYNEIKDLLTSDADASRIGSQAHRSGAAPARRKGR